MLTFLLSLGLRLGEKKIIKLFLYTKYYTYIILTTTQGDRFYCSQFVDESEFKEVPKVNYLLCEGPRNIRSTTPKYMFKSDTEFESCSAT